MKIGGLFFGYGGIDLAAQQVLGGELAWVSEIDPGACKVIAYRFPGVPNLGDVTAVDWRQVEPVDVLTAGFPCQPVSQAGKQLGTDDERWLFDEITRAIGHLDPPPRLLLLENVPRLRTIDRGNVMALVIQGLAQVGYVGRYRLLRASDVGAPHERERIFIVAEPAADAGSIRRRPRRATGTGEAAGRWALDHPAGRGLLPTPTASVSSDGITAERAAERARGNLTEALLLLPTPRATDGTKGGPGQRESSGDLMLPSAVTLLPTPAVNDMGEGKTIKQWDEWTDAMKAKHGNGNGHGKSLAIEAQRLLPTPRSAADRTSRSAATRRNSMSGLSLGQAVEIAEGTLPHEFESWDELPASWQPDRTLTDATVRQPERWGVYESAVRRWEGLTRPAPDPTTLSRKGNPQLSPRFVEWLMGLPDGWVTDVPGLSRSDMLRLLGNGVVPAQCAAALRWLLDMEGAA
jgi:DNA (cytosine-5)-methyltransferase 1